MPGITCCLPAPHLPLSTLLSRAWHLESTNYFSQAPLPAASCYCCQWKALAGIQKARRGVKLFYFFFFPICFQQCLCKCLHSLSDPSRSGSSLSLAAPDQAGQSYLFCTVLWALSQEPHPRTPGSRQFQCWLSSDPRSGSSTHLLGTIILCQHLCFPRCKGVSCFTYTLVSGLLYLHLFILSVLLTVLQ